MEKNIKAFGLALIALPFAFAMAGVLLKLGWIQNGEPWSWATFKGIVLAVCGAAYYLGLRLFSARDQGGRH